jgi:hypothetical protein
MANIFAGYNCSFAISKAGTTYSWGDVILFDKIFRILQIS